MGPALFIITTISVSGADAWLGCPIMVAADEKTIFPRLRPIWVTKKGDNWQQREPFEAIIGHTSHRSADKFAAAIASEDDSGPHCNLATTPFHNVIRVSRFRYIAPTGRPRVAWP
jgi:hypothetical protein